MQKLGNIGRRRPVVTPAKEILPEDCDCRVCKGSLPDKTEICHCPCHTNPGKTGKMRLRRHRAR